MRNDAAAEINIVASRHEPRSRKFPVMLALAAVEKFALGPAVSRDISRRTLMHTRLECCPRGSIRNRELGDAFFLFFSVFFFFFF